MKTSTKIQLIHFAEVTVKILSICFREAEGSGVSIAKTLFVLAYILSVKTTRRRLLRPIRNNPNTNAECLLYVRECVNSLNSFRLEFVIRNSEVNKRVNCKAQGEAVLFYLSCGYVYALNSPFK